MKSNFSIKDVQNYLDVEAEKLQRAILNLLPYAGEYGIILARNNGNYKDWTGNLRASVGYVIAHNGKIVDRGGFDSNAANNKTEGEKGAREGRKYAESLASKYTGYVLIIVAGMEYGVYVEKKKYDVVMFTKIEVERMVDKMMKRLFIKINGK